MLNFKKIVLVLLFCGVLSGDSWATEKGDFSLGVRSTVSGFGLDHTGTTSMGAGGQFRIHILKWLNTEWFADYSLANVGQLAMREDYHFGWSVMFYVMGHSRFWSPYILAGHCFDYTEIAQLKGGTAVKGRWSAAVQLGIGNHFNLSKNVDLSLSVQYMIHLGDSLEAEVVNYQGKDYAYIHEHSASLEGHVMITASINYKVLKLW